MSEMKIEGNEVNWGYEKEMKEHERRKKTQGEGKRF